MKQKKPSKSYLRTKADKLCREQARKIGRCEAEGEDDVVCKGYMEWCHCRTRGIMGLRYDRRNWFLLCSAHHRYYTNNPLAFAEFIKKSKGEDVYWFLMRYKVKHGLSTVEWYQEMIEKLKYAILK